MSSPEQPTWQSVDVSKKLSVWKETFQDIKTKLITVVEQQKDMLLNLQRVIETASKEEEKLKQQFEEFK